MMKFVLLCALILVAHGKVLVADIGTCKASHFSNGKFDIDASKAQCNQEKGYFPLLDSKTGECTCEKGFEFELKAEVSEPSKTFRKG